MTAVYSYTQLMAAINEVWKAAGKGRFVCGKSTNDAFRPCDFAERAVAVLTMLCDTNFQTARLTLRTRDMPSSEYLNS